MIKLIKTILQQFINDIDSGNSNISEKEQLEVLNLLQKLTQKEFSKLEAANYIGVSRATFDNYINKGFIPEGDKRIGFKEKFWYKKDLDTFIQKKK